MLVNDHLSHSTETQSLEDIQPPTDQQIKEETQPAKPKPNIVTKNRNSESRKLLLNAIKIREPLTKDTVPNFVKKDISIPLRLNKQDY